MSSFHLESDVFVCVFYIKSSCEWMYRIKFVWLFQLFPFNNSNIVMSADWEVDAPWRGLCPAAGEQEGSRPWWRCCRPSPPLYLPPSPGTSAAGLAVFPPSCPQNKLPPPSYGTATASQWGTITVNSHQPKVSPVFLFHSLLFLFGRRGNEPCYELAESRGTQSVSKQAASCPLV